MKYCKNGRSYPLTYHYRIKKHVLEKTLDASGEVSLIIDDHQATELEWNRLINQKYSHHLKAKNPNPLIGIIEKIRRYTFGAFVHLNDKQTIIDLGCDDGYMTENYVDRCRDIICVDADDSLLRKAELRLGTTNISYCVSDAYHLSLADESVDACIASEILEHLKFPALAVKEWMRVLRPGGNLFISVPNDQLILKIKTILQRFRLQFVLGGLSPTLAIGHLQLFTLASLKRLLMRHGNIQKINYLGPLFLNMVVWIKKHG